MAHSRTSRPVPHPLHCATVPRRARRYALGALLALAALSAAFPRPAQAHPHAFVDAAVQVVFDDKGLAGFRQSWELDPMVTASVFDLIGKRDDAPLTPAEISALEKQSMIHLKEYNYFNVIRIDGKPFVPDWATQFSASLKDRKVTYSFLVPCHVAATAKPKTVQLAIYDDTFYTYVAYRTEGSGPSLDPSKDPLFANPDAPARPEDFARFSKAVGATGYTGAVPLAGPVGRFKIAAAVKKDPSMAYFYDQIVPEAFRVTFSAK